MTDIWQLNCGEKAFWKHPLHIHIHCCTLPSPCLDIKRSSSQRHHKWPPANSNYTGIVQQSAIRIADIMQPWHTSETSLQPSSCDRHSEADVLQPIVVWCMFSCQSCQAWSFIRWCKMITFSLNSLWMFIFWLLFRMVCICQLLLNGYMMMVMTSTMGNIASGSRSISNMTYLLLSGTLNLNSINLSPGTKELTIGMYLWHHSNWGGKWKGQWWSSDFG